MMERSQIVPNVYESFYQQGKPEIVKMYNDLYMANLSPWELWFRQQSIDRRIFAGDQHNLNRYTNNSYEYLKFVFNKCQKLWNVVGGNQRKNRKGSRIVPVNNSSERTASQKTKIIQSVYDLDGTYEKISDLFDEAGITGLSLWHWWMDYREDPICGDLRGEVVTADMVMMDAFWKDPELTDCQFITTRKYLKKEFAAEMLPQVYDDVMSVNSQSAYYDNKFTYMPQQYNVRRKGIVAWDEFWYRTDRMATFVVDPNTYESYQYDGSKEKLEDLRNEFPDVLIIRERIPTVKLAIMINGNCFYDGPNPLSIDKYPYAVLVGYHDTAIVNYAYRYQGLIRNVRDAQYLYNYRKQLELDLLASQFSGVDVEVDSLVDNKDAFKVGPGKVRFFKKGKLGMLRDVPGANLNPVNPQVTEMIGAEIDSNAGVTPELLGMNEGNDVGITEMLRQNAALVTLQKLFDHLDKTQSNITKLADEIIEKNYTEGKIRRILNEEPTQEFRDRIFNKYACVVENAPITHTTKQMAFVQYYQLWKEGFPVPMEQLIDLLQVQDKDKWMEALQQQQQQQQQMQQQQAKLQLENQQIVNDNLKAKAESDRANAMEKIGKVQLDKYESIERLSKASQERENATLANIKAAKELEGMNLDHIMTLMDIIERITGRREEGVQKSTSKTQNVVNQ